MTTYSSDTALTAIIGAAAGMIGADLSTPENTQTAGELAAFLLGDRAAGDTYTVEPEADIDDMPGRPDVVTIRNNRANTGAALWVYRGRLEWEF